MDAVKFAREHTRMCNSFTGKCEKCPAYEITGCNKIDYMDELLPVVEKWSKEHTKITNLDHVAELLEKAGYKVDKEFIAKHRCPVLYSARYSTGPLVCPASYSCEECRKWWLKEFKEGE